MQKRWLVVMVGTILAATFGCSSDDGSNGHFKDEVGRDCHANGDDIECVGSGIPCDAPKTPSFILETLIMSPMRVCAACKSEDGSESYDVSSCKQVVCGSTADCGFPAATCKEGYCYCMPGQC
jgi:hypothetical protein